MPYVPNETHETRATSKLIDKLQQPKIKALLRSWVRGIQLIETCGWEVANALTLEGEGVVLDMIGILVQFGRNDLGDDDYRAALKAQIKIIRSTGKAPELAWILNLLEEGTWIISDTPPAAYTVEADFVVPYSLLPVLSYAIGTTRPLGVGATLIVDLSDDSGPFLFSFDNDDEPDPDHGSGFDDEGVAPGGLLSYSIAV